MESLDEVSLAKLIDPRLLWASVVAVLVATAVLGYWAVEVQAFELFYDFTRDHESWQLDHVVMVGLVFLTMVSLLTGVFAFIFAKRLVVSARAHLQAERRLNQAQQQAAVGTLLGGMAHHINNHLQPVILLTKMVQDNLPASSEDQKDLAIALEAAQRASAVLQRIKKITQVDSGSKGRCPIAATLKECAVAVGATLPAHIALDTYIAPVLGHVALSPTELDTVVGHLLRNSLDSIGSKAGKVIVQLTEAQHRPNAQRTEPGEPEERNHKFCSIRVADTGEGMTSDQVARIFDPFFTTKPQGQGMGLGLPEVQSLVEKAGGHIDVHSTPGQGTEVTVHLPLMDQYRNYLNAVDS